ncbi:MAG TPA: hypothetical protein VNQ77_00370 [Frankiaceae bacterium]|nr:hypothetical protein [Frankiaceae bacterium]
MRRRAAAVTAATLLGLLAPAVPASAAAPRVTLSGRVLDENGRGVATATVRFSVEVRKDPPPSSLADDLGDAFSLFARGLFCAFSFGFGCDLMDDDEPEAWRVTVNARTDASGRWAYAFGSGLRVEEQVFDDVAVTRPALIRGTLPPRTTTSVRYRGERTLPTIRLWLRGASVDKVSTTHRRIRAKVPAVLGTPASPVNVALVQGSKTAWSYGDVVGGVRTVDTRVVETGTTGTQTRVTTKIGSRYVTYRSGVRPVTKAVRPMSRGKGCYVHRLVPPAEPPRCELTDGRLGERSDVTDADRSVVVDLGRLSRPEAYVVRGCEVRAVAGSVEGVVYLDVSVESKERQVYTGSPAVPVRYVRLDVGTCWPREVSVFGAPFATPVSGQTVRHQMIVGSSNAFSAISHTGQAGPLAPPATAVSSLVVSSARVSRRRLRLRFMRGAFREG